MRDNGENNGNGDPIIDDIIDLVYLGLERLGIRQLSEVEEESDKNYCNDYEVDKILLYKIDLNL